MNLIYTCVDTYGFVPFFKANPNCSRKKEVDAMFFHFEITEAVAARRPFVALTGWLREGDVKLFDSIAIPCTDETTIVRRVGHIEARFRRAEYVRADELNDKIGIMVSDVEVSQIKIGSMAVGVQRKLQGE